MTTQPSPDSLTPPAAALSISPEEFDEIDAILDDLRQRFDETPQWEFCEGFMAALIVCRRAIPQSEYLPVLLDTGEQDGEVDDGLGSFADAAQRERFLELWQRRWNDIAQGLAAEVKSLDDERAYHPEVMDVRGAVAALPEAERVATAPSSGLNTGRSASQPAGSPWLQAVSQAAARPGSTALQPAWRWRHASCAAAPRAAASS